MTREECNGKLIFVLKLDECQVVKGQHLERVSLTLMTRALHGQEMEQSPLQGNNDDSIHTTGQEYFGVQSEKNIWWLAAFTLYKETYDSLKWYLHQTNIPSIIAQQSEGQTLHVLGVGSFEVEWHMAGDLKTLKCMLGCKLGATTLFPCIYCLHSRVEPNRGKKGSKGQTTARITKVGDGNSSNQNALTSTKSAAQWFQGILSCDRTNPPNRDIDDNKWDPILPIPLTRVHICSLHARLRILDKLLKLHINYAWNMEPLERRESCIQDLEEILNSIGLHGGMVTLHKDSKISTVIFLILYFPK